MLGEDQLAAERGGDPARVAGVDGEGAVAREVRVLGLLRGGQAAADRVQAQPVAGLVDDALVDLEAALGVVDELGAGAAGQHAVGRAEVRRDDDGLRVDPLRLRGGDVELGAGGRALRQQVALLAADQPDLVAADREVQRLVGGQVLVAAVVDDVAEAGGARRERHLEHGAVRVGPRGQQRGAPVGRGGRARPVVQAPAVVLAVRAVVVDHGRAGGLRVDRARVLGADGGVALLDPDLAGGADVDVAVAVDVLGAVVLDHEADVRGATAELDVGERAVRVTAGEGVAGGPGGGLPLGYVAPGVEVPAVVVLVVALVVHDRVRAGGGARGRHRRLGAGGEAAGDGAQVAAGVLDDGLVADHGAGRDGAQVLGHLEGDIAGRAGRPVVGGAEHLPRGVADLGREGDPVEAAAVDVRADGDGAGGAVGRRLQAELRRGRDRGEPAGRLVDRGGQRRDGDGDLLVGAADGLRAGRRVELVEVLAGREGVQGDGLRLGGVVHRDDVLDLLARVDPGERVDTRAVRRVPLDLRAVGERRVGPAQLGEVGDAGVERVGLAVAVGGAAGAADHRVAVVRRGLGRELVLPGVLVAACAGEALLVAVVDHRLAAGEELQLVGELVALEQGGGVRARVVGLQEPAEPADVVVAEEGRQFVGVALGGGVAVVLAVEAGEGLRGAALGDERARGVLERVVQGGLQLALGDVRGGDRRVAGVDLAEHEEVLVALLGGVRLERGRPLLPEGHVDVLDGVDPEAVDAGVLHPGLVDLLHAVDDLGVLGVEVVQAVEVTLGGGLADEGRVTPVVVQRGVVEPGRRLGRLVGLGGEDRRVRERVLRELRVGGGGAGRGGVGGGGLVDRHAVLVQHRVRALGAVGVLLLRVVDDVGGVVGDDVEEDLEAPGVRLRDQLLELVVGAEVRVDLGEVGDPVAVVARGGVRPGALDGLVLEDRRHPDRGGAEVLDVVELLDQAFQVATVVEALVGGVEAVVQPGTRDATGVVAGVPVREAVGQDEVELLAGQFVPRRGGGERGVRGCGRRGRRDGERGGAAEGGCDHRRSEQDGRAAGSAVGGRAPLRAGLDVGHRGLPWGGQAGWGHLPVRDRASHQVAWTLVAERCFSKMLKMFPPTP